ncbi:MAG: ABC transporter substrate-binding protein [Candidatus Limnocylindrales bacterium]
MRTSRRVTASLLAAVLALAACSAAASPSPSPSPVPPTATAGATASPTSTPNACAKENLKLLTPGTLTIGADNPSYPPYFIPDATKPAGSIWDLGDPTNGQGLEGATASAVAAEMGFPMAQVTWVISIFNVATQAGPKPFDMYLQEVSYSADRAQAVDLSDGYFDLNQAVVGLQGNPIAAVTTVAGLKAFRLGAPVGTTSYDYIVNNIQPTQDPRVFDTLDAAISALTGKSIDGIVVDLPTAFYMRDVQISGGTIVGSLPTIGQTEHFSILLTKGSPLTPCVNAALAAMKTDGSLAAIVDRWITSKGAPALK